MVEDSPVASAEEVEELRRQVRILRAALELDPTRIDAMLSDEFRESLTLDDHVKAIRLLRLRTGMSPAAAKRVYEEFAREAEAQEPAAPPRRAPARRAASAPETSPAMPTPA